jgi:hypothetical protein
MSDSPEPVSICLCERVLQDIFRKDAVSLVNVHNGISSQAFPTLIPVIYAFAQLKGHNKPFAYQFKISDPKKVVISASSVGQVEALRSPNALHKIISGFSGLVFPSEGTYTVALEIDGKVVASIPFEVDLVAAV